MHWFLVLIVDVDQLPTMFHSTFVLIYYHFKDNFAQTLAKCFNLLDP